ncbi:MAG: hypothetical protein ACRDTA_27405 [Pseudonocardiaceae bacterium]
MQPSSPPATSSKPSYVSFRLSDSGRLSVDITVDPLAPHPPKRWWRSAAVSCSAPIFAPACSSRSRSATTGALDQRPPTPVSSPTPSPLGLAVHPLPILYAGLPAARRIGVSKTESPDHLITCRSFFDRPA